MTLEQFQLAARPHYIECALCSSTDDADEPLDSAENCARIIDPNSVVDMLCECDQFIAAYWDLIVESEQSPEQCGQDFWLTRNHHGAGFWDRGYPKTIGDALTQAAHSEGGRDLYIGDDGRIYQL